MITTRNMMLQLKISKSNADVRGKTLAHVAVVILKFRKSSTRQELAAMVFCAEVRFSHGTI